MYTNRWAPATALDFFDSLDVFRDELERWMEEIRSPEVRGIFDRTLTPAVDVIETRDAFVVNVDVPGVSKKDLNVTLTGTVLSIQGEKTEEEKSQKNRKFFRKETWAGSFRRTLNLPETADPEKVTADLKDGVLTVTVQKREEVKPRLISVNVN